MKKRLLARILPSSSEEETRKSHSDLKPEEHDENPHRDDRFEISNTNDDKKGIHENISSEFGVLLNENAMNEDHENDDQLLTYWDEIPCDVIREICYFLFPLDYLRLLWLNKHWNECVLSFTNTVNEFRFTKYIYDRIMKSSFKYSERLYESDYSHSEEVLQSQYLVFKKQNEIQVTSLFRNLFNNITHLYFSDLFVEKDFMMWCLSGGRSTTDKNDNEMQNVNQILQKLTFFNCKLETGLAVSISSNSSQLAQIHLPYTGFFSTSKIFERGIRYDVFQTQYISFLTLKRALSAIPPTSTTTTSTDAQAPEILGNVDFNELRPFFAKSTNLSFETLKYIFLETYDEISESHISNSILDAHKRKLEQENSDELVFKKNHTFYTCATLPDLNTSLIIPLHHFNISTKWRKLIEQSASSISNVDSSDEEEEESQFGRKKTLQDLILLQNTVPSHMSLLCYCEIESFKNRSDSISSYIEAVSAESCYKTCNSPCAMASFLMNQPCTFDSILKYCNSIRERSKERSTFTLFNYYGIENHSPIYGHMQRLCDTICWGDIRHVEYLLNMGFHVHDLLFNTTLAIESPMTDEGESYEYFVADFMISLVFFGIVHSHSDSNQFADLLQLLSNFGMQKLIDPLLHELTSCSSHDESVNFDKWSTLDLLICLKLYRCMLSFSMIFPVLNSDHFVDIDSDEQDLHKKPLTHPNTTTKREQPMRFTKILKILQNAEASLALFENSSSQKTIVDEKLFVNISFWNLMLYREQSDERYDHASSNSHSHDDWNGTLEELDFDWILHCENEHQAHRLRSLFYRIESDPRFESPLLSAILNCNESGLRFLMDHLPLMNENYRTERFEEWLNNPRYYEGTRTISIFDMIHNNNILIQACDTLVLRPILLFGRWLLSALNQEDEDQQNNSINHISSMLELHASEAILSFIVDVFFEEGKLRTIPEKEVSMSRFLSSIEAKKKLPKDDLQYCFSVSEDRRLSILVYLTQLGVKSVSNTRKRLYRTK
ncbi:hypothetical protein FDP41_001209 [Naegleria fowleri]|uniref:F-box domain-containing protein n=1 Tax=Naegleria fowleri TaxID=5763 RepID=A0A6A5BXH3_NAEFO|nr:uncharacterized protein FDP41_001209 [Naegleria fowleri]KAF0980056.1 hypothetical protein FDP41_001209 [Naegleria fowleri]